MRLDEVLARFPKGKEFLKVREDGRARIQSLMDEVAQRHREFHAADAEWQQAAREATEQGRLAPLPPTPLDPAVQGQAVDFIRAEEARLAALETDLVCALAEEVTAYLKDKEVALLEKARPHLGALQVIIRDLSGILSVYVQVLTQQQKRMTAIPRPSLIERVNTRVTLDRLVDAIEFETSFFDLDPVKRKRSPFESDEDAELTFTQGQDGSVRLGLS